MPTTNDIRLAWAVYHDRRETREDRQNTALWETMRDDAYADFDQWLADRDRDTRNLAFQEAANIAFKRKSGYETGIDLIAAANEPEPADMREES